MLFLWILPSLISFFVLLACFYLPWISVSIFILSHRHQVKPADPFRSHLGTSYSSFLFPWFNFKNLLDQVTVSWCSTIHNMVHSTFFKEIPNNFLSIILVVYAGRILQIPRSSLHTISLVECTGHRFVFWRIVEYPFPWGLFLSQIPSS